MKSPIKVRFMHNEKKLSFLNDVRGAPGGPGFIMFLNERKKGCPPVQEAVQGNSGIVSSMMKVGEVGCYFTPANYRTLNGRAAKNVANLQCLFLDIDAGPDKPYEDAETVCEAAFYFATDIQMPISYVVSTGGGVHVYWLLQEPLEVERWKRLALGLKAETHRKNLKADDSVTGDAARLLRIPGSFNFKLEQKRSCEIIYSKKVDNTVIRHSYDALAERLISREPPAVALINPREPATDENIAKVKSALEHISADCDYNRWLSILMALHSTRWPGAEELARRWSRTAPARYNAVDFDQTWRSLAADGAVKLGTLFHVAGENGWGPPDRAADIIECLNERHAVVMIGGRCAVLNETSDPVLGTKDITLSGVSDFQQRYGNRTVQIGTRQQPVAKVWLSHKNRRQYEGIVFAPGRNIADYYNLDQGFSVEPKVGNCSKFLAHISSNICSDNSKRYEYLISWMADAVQNRDARPGVAVVMRGGEGVGKGFFAREFGALFGPHFLHISQIRHLTGHFNAILKDKLMVFADEAVFAADRSVESVLKAVISEPTHVIEFKGKDAIQFPNYIRAILATNADWAVPAGKDSRRYFVLDVAPNRKNDRNYFRALAEELASGGREALLHFLLNRDIKDVDLGDFPKTEALHEQRLFSSSALENWWHDRLMAGEPIIDYNEWPDQVPTGRLYDDYQTAAQKRRERFIESETEFGVKLRKITPPGWDKKRLRVPGAPQKRANYYILPPLEECRDYYTKVMGAGIDWPEEET